MECVLGVGGIFFKARDPAKLKAWYRDHLGLPTDEQGETIFQTQTDPGPCLVWAPFPADTTYFEPSKAPFMINFRVPSVNGIEQQTRVPRVNNERHSEQCVGFATDKYQRDDSTWGIKGELRSTYRCLCRTHATID